MPKRIKPEKPLRDSLASHRQEPEEEVRGLVTRVQSLVEGREVIFFSVLVGILVILGGTGIYWFLKSNENSLAAERLSVAYAAYREALFPGGIQGAQGAAPAEREGLLENAQAIEQIAKDHPGSPAGAMASYLAGNAYLRAGASKEAIPLLKGATEKLEPDGEAWRFALEALGYAYEAEGRHDRALEVFTRLSQVSETRFRLEGLLGRSRALWNQGKEEEALAIYQAARTEFPDDVDESHPAASVSTVAPPGEPPPE